MRGYVNQILIKEADRTISNWRNTGNRIDQRCFARAVRTDNRDKLAAIDCKRHVPNRGYVAIGNLKGTSIPACNAIFEYRLQPFCNPRKTAFVAN